MVVFETLFAGIVFAIFGVIVTTRPREMFGIRQSVPVASTAELGEFGIARYQTYGLLCVLAGVVLAVVPLFLP